MEPLQRRSLLLTLAGVGVSAVAGCSDDGNGDGGTTDGTTGDDGSDGEETTESSPTETTNSTEAEAPPTIAEPVEPTFAGKFTPAGARQYTRFGWSLDAAGSLVLVGADRDGGPEPPVPATAALYEWTGQAWRERAAFTGENVGDGFAHAVALSSDLALIGTPGDNERNAIGVGSAVVYERVDDTWEGPTTLSADDGDENHAFGDSVALSGQRALIGAPGENSMYGIGSGAAYVFATDDDGWTQRAKLKPEDGDSANNFGHAVGLARETAVVGAPRASDRRGNEAGRVVVFERADGEWVQRTRLFAGESRNGVRFGWDVDASGDRFVVGAPGAGAPGGTGTGEAYVFQRSEGEWVQEAMLTDEDGPEDPRGFGFAVAMLGNLVVVGAPLADAPYDEEEYDDAYDADALEGGRATVFQRIDGEWTNQGTITGRYVQGEDHCGWSVAVTPEMALTGTPLHERPAGQDVGTVQYFDF